MLEQLINYLHSDSKSKIFADAIYLAKKTQNYRTKYLINSSLAI